jgi:hypothetical protein
MFCEFFRWLVVVFGNFSFRGFRPSVIGIFHNSIHVPIFPVWLDSGRGLCYQLKLLQRMNDNAKLARKEMQMRLKVCLAPVCVLWSYTLDVGPFSSITHYMNTS